MSLFPPSHTITFEAALDDLRRGSRGARLAAAQALGEIGGGEWGARARAALLVAIEDSHPDVRCAAASALGMLGDADASSALVSASRDLDRTVRQHALIALGRLGCKSTFAAVAGVLREGPPDARFQAATSLVAIDPERAFEPLVAALDDDDAEVLSAVALALATTGDGRAGDQLVRLLDHPRPATRFDAAYALAQLRDARAVAPLSPFVTDPELAWDAIEALERVADIAALAPLAALLGNRRVASGVTLRAAAAVLSLRSDDANARSALLAGLSRFGLETRSIAVEQLAKVGGRWAIGPLEDTARRWRGRRLRAEIADAVAQIQKRGEHDPPA